MKEIDDKLTELQLSQKCKHLDALLVAFTSYFALTFQFLDQENRIRDQEVRDIINWISPLNFWQTQNDNFERRQKGTGEWLLNDPKFMKWLTGSTNILWCPGDRTVPFVDRVF